MMKITKFGGSSVANAQQFRKVKHIIESDPARRFVVVSASGREHKKDNKVTDLQYLIEHQKIEGTLEIGPGKTLSKFAKQVDAGLTREHIETRLDYENFVKEHAQWS